MSRKSRKLFHVLRTMDAHVRRNAPQVMTCQRCNGTGWAYAEDWEQGYHIRFKTQCQSCKGRGSVEPPQDSATCALADCDEPAAVTCPCCNRQVCLYDIDGAVLDIPPGLCHECLLECAGGMACKVVTK